MEGFSHGTGDRAAVARFGSPVAIRRPFAAEQAGEFDSAFEAALTAAGDLAMGRVAGGYCRCGGGWTLLTEEDPQRWRQRLGTAAEVGRTWNLCTGSVALGWP